MDCASPLCGDLNSQKAKPMNIGVDLRCLQTKNRTGVGEYAFQLLKAIFEIDNKNNYYLFFNTSSKEFQPPTFNKPNVFQVRFKYPNIFFNFSSLFFSAPKIDLLLKKHFKFEKIDYFFSPNLNFTSLSKEVKHILTIHDLTFELLPHFITLKQRLWHFLLRAKNQCQKAFQITTPSENTKRDIIYNYGIEANKIKSIFLGLPTHKENNGLDSDNDLAKDLPENYLLYLGTLEPRKNIISIIKAFESVAPTLKIKYELVIAGAPGWKYKSILQSLKNSPLKNQIRLLGYINEGSKNILYKNAKLFIYPSFYEGFGLPVLEAMHFGVPVITSNRSSLSELADGSCHLVNPHRPEEIALGMERILNDVNYAESLRIKGKNRAQNFSWQNAAIKWLELLK